RSFTEPPGLKYSTLARTVALMPLVTLLSRTSGVLPTRLIVESWNCTVVSGCLQKRWSSWSNQRRPSRDGSRAGRSHRVGIGAPSVRGKHWVRLRGGGGGHDGHVEGAGGPADRGRCGVRRRWHRPGRRG